jgi:copper(I)-binding protein
VTALAARPAMASGMVAAAIAAAVALVVGATALRSGSPASGGPSRLSVHDARLGETVSNVAALYLRITNRGGADTLVGAVTPVADGVVLHRTDVVDGVPLMRAVATVELAAGSEVMFEPGGAHVMLEGVHGVLTAGDEVRVELRFEHHAPIVLDVPVVALASLSEAG